MFWSQHLGCWGQNTSRIQNKEVYATLCLQANRHGPSHPGIHPFAASYKCYIATLHVRPNQWWQAHAGQMPRWIYGIATLLGYSLPLNQ